MATGMASRVHADDSASGDKLPDSIFVNIGGATPVNPASFTADQANGYNGGIGFGFGISRIFQLVIDANADTFPLNTSQFPGIGGGAIRIGTLFANARLRFIAEDNPVVPYFIGGLGGATVTQDSFTLNGSTLISSTSNTNGALRVGLGIDIKLNKGFALFVEDNGIGISGSNGGSNISYNSFRLGGKFNL